MNPPAEIFRARLICTCGAIVHEGPWTETMSRPMAAYQLGRAPSDMLENIVFHLREPGHALAVEFETRVPRTPPDKILYSHRDVVPR